MSYEALLAFGFSGWAIAMIGWAYAALLARERRKYLELWRRSLEMRSRLIASVRDNS